VLTIGVGGLGQYGLKLLHLLSGAPIIAVDTSEEKRALAKKLGATHVLDGRAKDLTEQIRSLTGGEGVSAALDFVGADATLATAAKLVRSGGLLLHVGLAGGAARMKPLDTTSFEVRYEAPLWGNLRELREVIALVESGRLTLNETEFVPLDRINDVYRRLKAGEVKGRAVMVPG
jgi:propanol-preferring alcohol dehydrogenase